MKRIFVVLMALAAIMAFVTTTDANVMVYGLRAEPPPSPSKSMLAADLFYMLNEDADNGVTIEIYDASADTLVRTITDAPNKRGPNAVLWDGKNDADSNVAAGDYYFTVTASDDGHADWDMISDDGPYYIMYSGKGIDVNKDPNSIHFGKVYVSSSSQGTSGNPGGFEQFDGVYSYWPHGTPVGFYNGYEPPIFDIASGSSPWKLTVGPDDHVYVCDFSDGDESLWEFDPDLTTATEILAPGGNNDNPVACVVIGTGADRVLYTADEEMNDYDIWRYEIGNGPFPYTGGEMWFESEVECMGETFADFWDFVFSSDGTKLYTIDDQGPASPLNPTPAPSIAVWDITGATPSCIGLVPTDAQPAEIFCRTYGIDLDETRNRILTCGRYNGLMFILDLNTLAITDTFPNGSGLNRDCCFDAAGNVYAVNSTIEWWRVYSPPDGPNTFSTKYPLMFKIGGLGVDEYVDVPSVFTVKNTPNPFSSATEIVYSIPSRADCSIKIYDVSGKLVRNLVDETLEPGSHRVSWDGTNDAGMRLASGVYFYRVLTGNTTITKEVILVR